MPMSSVRESRSPDSIAAGRPNAIRKLLKYLWLPVSRREPKCHRPGTWKMPGRVRVLPGRRM